MRVLVELYDKEPVENVVASLVFQPEIVVYLCDLRDVSLVKENAVYRLFRKRKLRSRPRFYYLDTTDPAAIVEMLEAVWYDYPGCIFDFTGGRDLLLLQAGVFCAQNGVSGFFIDLPTGRCVNIRGCARLAEQFRMPAFTADDVMALTGAAIRGHGHFDLPEDPENYRRNSLEVWRIVEQNPRLWGSFVTWLQAAAGGGSSQRLDVERARLPANGQAIHHVLEKLLDLGLLAMYRRRDQEVQLRFGSPQARKALLNQGIWLELYCYFTALGTHAFDDVRTSIVIDWSAEEAGPESTKNEVDVFLVKGIVPVFISCKMSVPSPLALAEIRLLALKLGGAAGRAVLVCAGQLGPEHKALRGRAADMGVALLDKASLEKGVLAEELLALVAPPEEPPRRKSGFGR